MERKLRTCAVCRSQYHYCPKCNEDKDKETWYFTFCSENCKDIYNTTSNFEDNQVTATEAREKLDKLDLSKFDDFGMSYKSSINKIMEYTTVKETEIQTVESIEPVNETDIQPEVTEVIEENIEENIEKEKSIKKPRTRKARNVEE